MKYWCKHFVPVSGLVASNRTEAARWALDKFGTQSVEIFYNNGNGVPGFFFEKEKDAVLFALKWS